MQQNRKACMIKIFKKYSKHILTQKNHIYCYRSMSNQFQSILLLNCFSTIYSFMGKSIWHWNKWNFNTTFKFLLVGNVFAVPTTSSDDFIGSDQFLETGWWSNQYDATICCDVKIDWCSVPIVSLVFVGLTSLSQIEFPRIIRVYETGWGCVLGTSKMFPVSENVEVVLKF